MNQDRVLLKCVKDDKPKIKIVSAGYLQGSNCRFPSAGRIVGTYYSIPRSDLKLVNSVSGRAHYSAMSKDIRVELDPSIFSISNAEKPSAAVVPLKVYQDVDVIECIICYTNPKNIIFSTCGHYSCCSDCAKQCIKSGCPLCRQPISSLVSPDMVD
jgi:hypothetical protein